ncbi:MAG: hypothetical protein GY708_06785 [Actinomycetia bacterium]|nr:hypothetical protein [Actinomycetes bacterium]
MTNPIAPDRRARLEQIMAGLAAGDDAMISALMFEFGPELERAARYHAKQVATGPVRDGDIVGLTADFAFAVAHAAKSWRPDGGALPWTFARRALRQLAIDVLVTPVQLRRSLAEGVPAVRVVLDRWHTVPDQHITIALEYRMQQQQGDPSAAATVAERHAKTADNVRQIASRVWRRVADVEFDDIMVS